MKQPAGLDAATNPATNADGGIALAYALSLLQDAKNDIAKLRLAIGS